MKHALLAVLLLAAAHGSARAGTPEDALLDAVRAGDMAAVKTLLDQGVPVDAKFRYDRTALSFAADRGQFEMVKLLLERGADVDARDTFYHNTAPAWAAYKGHTDVVKLMLAKSTASVSGVLMSGIFGNKPEIVEAALATGKINARDLSYALQAAEKQSTPETAAALRKAGARPPPAADAKVDPATLARYTGLYRSETDPKDEFTLSVADGALNGTFRGRTFKLGAIDASHFQHLEAPGRTLEMKMDGERVVGATIVEIGSQDQYKRVEETKP